MKIIIRKPNLNLLVDGIPKDFAEVRDYFNQALENNALPWIPRKTPITNKEIKELWIPTINTNITLVVELERKVVGQVTVFYDSDSTAYEHAKQRLQGDIGLTAKPEIYSEVVEKLIPEIVKELQKKEKTAKWTLAKESPANKILLKLGYQAKILKNVERYKQVGLSGDVFEYNLSY